MALQRRNRHDGCDRNARCLGKCVQGLADIGKRQRRLTRSLWLGWVFQRVELVHGKHDAGHAQQVHQQGVPACLGQQAVTLVSGRQLCTRLLGPGQFGRVHQHHGGVGTAGRGDHVAGVLLVAGRIANDEFALGGVEVAVSHINRDALLALGREAIGEQGQIGLATFGHIGQLVQQDRAAVDQQAANQRALAIIHGAAGDEFQG